MTHIIEPHGVYYAIYLFMESREPKLERSLYIFPVSLLMIGSFVI